MVAGESITLKPSTWIKPGSNFSAKINLQSNVSVNVPTDYIKKVELNYQCDLLSNKVFKVKNILKKEINKVEDTSNETKIDYDSYNNPTKITTIVKEGATVIQTNITDMTYQNLTLPVYVIGRQLSKVHNITLGNEKMTTDELYSYNSAQLLSQIQKKGDASTSYITEDRTYDLFGNILKKTLKAGQEIRELNFEYDSSGRFLNKTIDAEKLVSTFQYNTDGTLKSETSPLLQTRTYEYDVWLKKTKEADNIGNSYDYKYENINGGTIVTKTYANGFVEEETFDDLGRKIKSGSKNIMGTFTYISYLYDIQDRNYKVSEPYIGASPSQWNENIYDSYGRIITKNVCTGKIINISYSGLITKVNDGITIKSSTKDAIGNVVSICDIPSNEIKYTYFANGNLKESDYDGIKVKVTQDGWGRKIQIDDPSAGIFKYKYNDFGELISEENTNGTTTYKLSNAGRVDEKTIKGLNTDSKTTYRYDTANKLLLSSTFEDMTNGANTITIDYTYDKVQRISKKTETTPFAVFTKDLKYDSFGRIDTEDFTASRSGKSSVRSIKYNYKNGHRSELVDTSTNTVLWQTKTVNANGQLLSGQNGSVAITNSYDQYGYPLQFKYDKLNSQINVLTLKTDFDTKTENLKSRTNSLFSWNENFDYDTLDRLIDYNNVQGIKTTQAYDNKGRIIQNDLGTYTYSKTNPYQNEAINVTSGALTYYTAKPSQVISYNVFKSPVLIDEKGIEKISFDYNSNNSRTAVFYGDLQVDKLKRPYHKYYSEDGTMEIKENIATGILDFVTYIGGDGYTAPLLFKSDGAGNQKYLYLLRDYQGSIVSIADQSGTIVEKRIFDAWGAVAKVQDGSGNTLAGLTLLDRGYTGHEHLQSVGLINMNGRIYDPKLHRFLQPDNNIQDPFNTQSYNRYGYVVNNPLKFTDPSGEIWGFVLGFAASLYVHGGSASGGETNPFKWNSSTWVSAFSGTASSVASYNATTGLNSYTENYNNKPILGASAIGPGYDMASFVNNGKNTFDFKAENNIGDNRPLIEQYNDHPREPYDDYDSKGAILTGIGTGVALGEYKMFNKDTWYSIKKMKTYNQSFNGNGATGGKVASALKISKTMQWGGRAIGAYNAWSTYDSYSNNQINGFTFAIEETSNAYSTFGGTNGVCWGIGWEIGRWTTSWDAYQKWKRETVLPWRREKLGY